MNQRFDIALQRLRSALPTFTSEIAASMLDGNGRVWRLVADGGESVVLKLGDPRALELGLDFNTGLLAAERAAEVQVAPAVLWSDPQTQTIVYDYVRSCDSPADPRRLGALLRSVHRLSIRDLQPIDYAERMRRYVALSPSGSRRAGPVIELAQKLQQTEDPALCHHDLNANNIVPGPAGLRLIDWEYAATGDRHFDLAALVVEFALDKIQQSALLEAYGIATSAVRLRQFVILYRALCEAWDAAVSTTCQ